MAYGHDLDGCGRCVKYTLHFVNLLIFLGGLVLLAIGIWSITSKTFVNELLGTNLYIGAVYIVLITGAIITFISCLGCYGSAHEIRCMLLLVRIFVFISKAMRFESAIKITPPHRSRFCCTPLLPE